MTNIESELAAAVFRGDFIDENNLVSIPKLRDLFLQLAKELVVDGMIIQKKEWDAMTEAQKSYVKGFNAAARKSNAIATGDVLTTREVNNGK